MSRTRARTAHSFSRGIEKEKKDRNANGTLNSWFLSQVKRNVELELEAVQALQEQQLTSQDGIVDCSVALMGAGEDSKEVRKS